MAIIDEKTDELKIKLVTPKCIDDLIFLKQIEDSIALSGSKIEIPKEDEEKQKIEHRLRKQQAYLAYLGERAVGYLFFKISPELNLCAEESLFVLPFQRKKGVGSTLLTELINYCKYQKIKEIIAYSPKNNYAAQEFYKKMKFVERTKFPAKRFPGHERFLRIG